MSPGASPSTSAAPSASAGVPGLRLLPQAEWRERERKHRLRLERWTAPHLARRRAGRRHPVYDFLFEYYNHPVAKLLRWSPGPGVLLEEGGLFQPGAFPASRIEALRWTLSLLRATEGRPAHHGCFGLHEWAMVYRMEEAGVRHGAVPLRFPPAELARIVESQPIACSHYDAFRFFTSDARPLNRLQPTRENRHDLEQPGCLHANMDLYKWAYKFAPWTSGELLADGFELAVAIREIDMRASPYDFVAHGMPEFPSVPIETPEGRAEYEALQRGLAERARPLRRRLIAELEAIQSAVAAVTNSTPA
ncbi:hypothetical protein SAMN05444156_2351 [Verrucomicrobium sp. GAS474]|uniref:hypothetical protein n=1 Tax=Verrucomicrobium sp. GAS474 TaxID=1882831 RepID=UPI00087ABF08|nr:hypothetical protein [Verrucomicrobium sp. GAS474]SDU16459.1 hypothetical protein SAMN05444156_2351 [Verrucomicrobium sp. GAS474]